MRVLALNVGVICLNQSGSFGLANILMMAVFFVAIYFLLIRPNAKKRKKEDEMRRSLKVGDEVTTIGGIVGKIVGIKDGADTFVIETGVDRSKIKIKRWAIASCETVRADKVEKSGEHKNTGDKLEAAN